MGRIPTTVALTRGDGLVARFGAVCLVVAGESPSTERILGAAETAATAADPGVAIAQRLAATVFSGGSGQPPAFGVVAPTAGGILVLLHGPVLAVVEGPEGTRRLSGERAMTWADEIIRDPVRRISVRTEGPAATPVPHTDLRAGVAAAGGFILHAPPTGLTARPRRPSDTNPELHPPQPPATDLTRRAPLPTPSHTRFGSEPIRLPLQSPGAPPQPAAGQPGDPPAVYDRRAATFPVGGTAKPQDPAVGKDRDPKPITESASGAPQPAAQVDDPPATAAIAPNEPPDAAKSKPEKSAEPAPASQRPDNPKASKPAREDRPDPDDQPPTAAFDAEAAAAEDTGEQSSTPAPQSVSGPHSAPGPQPTPTPRESAPGPGPGPGLQPTPSSRSAPAPQAAPRPQPAPQPSPVPAEQAARSAGPAPMETVAYQAGALVGPDGARYPLDRPYVIGRDPMIDDSVRRAQASPIVIPRDRHVSRVHAHLTVGGGTVFVRDAGTPGGTFMAAPGAPEWMRVGQRPVELQRGWSLRIGERIFTYRTDQGHS